MGKDNPLGQRTPPRRKPRFVVKASAYCRRVRVRWRYPRGRHSPIRQKHRGKPPLPAVGYGSPDSVKCLLPAGLWGVVVNQVKEILSLNPAREGAIISSRLGGKKRLELLKLAEEKKIKVLNVRNVSESIARMEKDYLAKKKSKLEKFKEKGKKEEEKKKKVEEKKPEEKTETIKSEKGAIPPPEGVKAEEEKELMEETIIKRQ